MGKLEILTIPAMLQTSFKDFANRQSLVFAGVERTEPMRNSKQK